MKDQATANRDLPKAAPRPMDRTIRGASRIDRILDEMPEPLQKWVLGYLVAKYGPVPVLPKPYDAAAVK